MKFCDCIDPLSTLDFLVALSKRIKRKDNFFLKIGLIIRIDHSENKSQLFCRLKQADYIGFKLLLTIISITINF